MHLWEKTKLKTNSLCLITVMKAAPFTHLYIMLLPKVTALFVFFITDLFSLSSLNCHRKVLSACS